MEENNPKRLDYSISNIQDRVALVQKICDETPKEKLTPYYLDQIARYLTETKQSKKQKEVLSSNRMVTINRREISFQGLVAKLGNGEDGIYNFMTGGDRNILLVPKIGITQEDIRDVPGLRELREQIKKIQILQKAARGKRKYLLTKQLIQMRQDQYILKSSYKPPITATHLVKSVNNIDLSEKITLKQTCGQPLSNCLVSLFNPTHISFLLASYSKLKEQCYGRFESDWWYLMQDLDNLIEKTLNNQDTLYLYKILIYKIDGLSNKEIAAIIKKEFQISYSLEYISSLWRQKIPKMLAERARLDWLLWHFTNQVKGKWKKCSKCHEIKLAHPFYYTKNKTAKDGFYSQCKCCRKAGKISKWR